MGSPIVWRSSMETQAPAITALGSLFRLTQVSLWYFSFFRCIYFYVFFLNLFLRYFGRQETRVLLRFKKKNPNWAVDNMVGTFSFNRDDASAEVPEVSSFSRRSVSVLCLCLLNKTLGWNFVSMSCIILF